MMVAREKVIQMPTRRIPIEAIISISIVTICVSILLAVQIHGRNSRVYLTSPRISAIKSLHNALAEWTESGIRGRVLLLFARNVGEEQMERLVPLDAYKISDDNYVYLAIKRNLLRSVYHVLKDADLEEASKTLRRFPSVAQTGNSFRSGIDDAPLIITRVRELGHFNEPVIILIDCDYIAETDIRTIISTLKHNGTCSDLISLSGNVSPRLLKEVEAIGCAK